MLLNAFIYWIGYTVLKDIKPSVLHTDAFSLAFSFSCKHFITFLPFRRNLIYHCQFHFQNNINYWPCCKTVIHLQREHFKAAFCVDPGTKTVLLKTDRQILKQCCIYRKQSKCSLVVSGEAMNDAQSCTLCIPTQSISVRMQPSKFLLHIHLSASVV